MSLSPVWGTTLSTTSWSRLIAFAWLAAQMTISSSASSSATATASAFLREGSSLVIGRAQSRHHQEAQRGGPNVRNGSEADCADVCNGWLADVHYFGLERQQFAEFTTNEGIQPSRQQQGAKLIHVVEPPGYG